MGVETAVEKPVHAVLSGPAAGVIGAVALSGQAGEPNTIGVDMGGTSFDICLSYRGEVRRTQESEIAGLPVKVPMVDVHTLGAGGGGVAWIEPGGALRAGRESAGRTWAGLLWAGRHGTNRDRCEPRAGPAESGEFSGWRDAAGCSTGTEGHRGANCGAI